MFRRSKHRQKAVFDDRTRSACLKNINFISPLQQKHIFHVPDTESLDSYSVTKIATLPRSQIQKPFTQNGGVEWQFVIGHRLIFIQVNDLKNRRLEFPDILYTCLH
jgi:hypothetical protein